MLRHTSALTARAGWGAVIGLVSMMAVAASPAAAQSSACLNGSNVIVQFLGTGTGNTIIFEQLNGEFQGQVRVFVFCNADFQLVPNSMVTLTSTIPNSFVLADPANNTWVPASTGAQVSLPSGTGLITIKSANPNLTGWQAQVGSTTVTVTQAFGQPLSTILPTAQGGVWAQTPELGSLALFGAGAAGMAGYALTRLRAGIGRRRE